MFRFMVLTWNTSSEAASARARFLVERLHAASADWKTTLRKPGLAVFHADEWPGEWSVYPMERGVGVVFGSLYRRRSSEWDNSRDVALDSGETAAILNSAGLHLIERYWGSYVAVIHNADARTVWIVRDPQGGMPCHITYCEGVNIFFSNVEDCVALRALKFSINWRYIRAYICNAGHSARITGLNEVLQVVPGESLKVRPDGTTETTQLWNPVRIAQTNIIEDQDEAIAAIRSITRMCVWTRVAGHKSVLHHLSGFDSTVVLSCLRSAPNNPAIVCINSYDTLSPEDDERFYARLAAAHAGCELVEVEREVSHIRLSDVLKTARRVRPINYHSALQGPHIEEELAAAKNATALFSGTAGDQVFYNGLKNLIPVDHLRRQGPRAEFFRIVLDAAKVERVSIWTVLHETLRTAIFSQRGHSVDDITKYVQLVERDVIDSVRCDPTAVHPWLECTSGLPPGKRYHIRMLMGSMDPYHPLGLRNSYTERSPLLEQPLVETGLRIPIDVLSKVHEDRFAARQAFAADIPNEILSRHSKGGVGAYLVQLLTQERQFLLGFMREGLLVQQQLLDRSLLEDVLSSNHCPSISVAGELVYEHFNTEAWLKRWADVVDLRA